MKVRHFRAAARSIAPEFRAGNVVGVEFEFHSDRDAGSFDGIPYYGGDGWSGNCCRLSASDLDGTNRIRVAGDPDHLYFGTSWSPDGQFILFQDCHYKTDPGHDWSDICIGRPDGSDVRVLTTGQSHWFGATYGTPQNRGGGSNMPMWTHDGAILFSRKLPGSKVPWEFQPERPDTDHFNREFKPDQATGGTEICRLDPRDGHVIRVTQSDPPVWDFRASESPNGRRILFCRAGMGQSPAIWTISPDGTEARLLTRGLEEKGADHPRWLP